MKNGWPMVPLGEVLRRSDDWISIDPQAMYREVTVRLWGKGVTQRRECLGAEIKSDRRLRVRPGQFIASRIDARNGAFGLIPDELDGAVVTNDFPVFAPDKAKLHVGFLGWLSKTNSFIDLCRAASEGTTNRVRLKEDRFLATAIPLPPIEEQRRIVGRIEVLAGKVIAARGFHSDVTEAAHVLERNAAWRFMEGVSARRVQVGEVVGVRGGGTPSKANPLFWEGDVPWVSPKDMKQREIRDAIDHISDDATQSCSAKKLPVGAVLVVVRGMILAHTVPSAVLRVPAAINQDMKALVPCNRLLPEYLCAGFWAMNDKLLALVEKSTHDTRKLLTERLVEFEIPLPSIAEQRRIVAHLDALSTKIASIESLQQQSAAQLHALLPSILDRAFKGELM